MLDHANRRCVDIRAVLSYVVVWLCFVDAWVRLQRTVEDFEKCGGKASNGYNFPFISDCVYSDFNGACTG